MFLLVQTTLMLLHMFLCGCTKFLLLLQMLLLVQTTLMPLHMFLCG